MDVENLSEKQKNPAQPATENTPTKQTSSEADSTLNTKPGDLGGRAEQTSSPEPFQLIPPFKISGKAKSMAKGVGIDLSSVEEMAPRMNSWASSVEERLNIILGSIDNIPAKTIEVLKAQAEQARAEYAAKAQAQAPAAGAPAQGGGMMESLGQFLPAILQMAGGGSGGYEGEITKKVMEAGLNQMFAGTRLLEAMQTKMLANMGAKVVEDMIPK